MKIKHSILIASFLVAIFGVLTYCIGSSKSPKGQTAMLQSMPDSPFLNHRKAVPDSLEYAYPLFQLSHNYPDTFNLLVNPPWQQALNGQPIGESNALIYMDSLKSYIAPHLIPFFTDNPTWNAASNGWFHEPWLGTERESILGTYQGNGNPAGMFPELTEDETGYVLTMYDSQAAYTVGQIWGKTGQKINLLNNAAQFKEGSIIVKLAFSNINYPAWPDMKGAQTFYIYDTTRSNEDNRTGYHTRQVSFFQMDVIVKDSKTSPKTGWVYSTFVHDPSRHGTTWEKMVPLGAMWGNDPEVKSPVNPPYPKLRETVINKDAPVYSKETLGWGGRLSGPNDGAVFLNVADENGTVYPRLAMSSCMSCHLPAQDTFLASVLPGPNMNNPTLTYVPGSPKWNLWFRDNPGTMPFTPGQIATDYDMVMALKSIPAYNAAHPDKENKNIRANIEALQNFRKHHSANRQ